MCPASAPARSSGISGVRHRTAAPRRCPASESPPGAASDCSRGSAQSGLPYRGAAPPSDPAPTTAVPVGRGGGSPHSCPVPRFPRRWHSRAPEDCRRRTAWRLPDPAADGGFCRGRKTPPSGSGAYGRRRQNTRWRQRPLFHAGYLSRRQPAPVAAYPGCWQRRFPVRSPLRGARDPAEYAGCWRHRCIACRRSWCGLFHSCGRGHRRCGTVHDGAARCRCSRRRCGQGNVRAGSRRPDRSRPPHICPSAQGRHRRRRS